MTSIPQVPPDDQKIVEPPPYVPNIDSIFLQKLSEPDRFLVTKLDEISQKIQWAIVVAINNHNNGIDYRARLDAVEARLEKLERENPVEDSKLLKWVRENLAAPAKILFWIATAAGSAWIGSMFK